MLSNRFLLSLVAGLFFSTLASANSTDVAQSYLHSSAFNSANNAGHSLTSHSLTIGGKGQPTMFVAYNHTTTSAIGEARMGATVSGMINYVGGMTGSKTASIVFPQRRYGPTCCETRNWVGSGRSPGSTDPGLSTPEPGSLMLLSTGLLGIAGMAKRKLRLG